MRIGLYGGTFDPIHLGHLILAEQCREQLQLDAVWFIPAGEPPHKPPGGRTPGRQRLEMLELAIAGHDRFQALDIEVNRSGPSFTVETLTELHQPHPSTDFWWLMGADAVRDFPTWREPERIVTLARLGAVNRGGIPIPEAITARERFGDRIDDVTMPTITLSSSDIRQRVSEGKSVRYLVTRSVEVYIQQHGLYRGSPAESSQPGR
ncbi:MAG: nicotinate-nucleotide adenylyltransferase [Planctomycetaceae bacterium]|nr:nicotinate-nucleotide adenylyltransferase [Planctomycetaceae bacterium]